MVILDSNMVWTQGIVRLVFYATSLLTLSRVIILEIYFTFGNSLKHGRCISL